MTKSIKEIESVYGKLSVRRLNSEWNRKKYVNKDVVKYVLSHKDDANGTPLLQAIIKRKDISGHSTDSGAWNNVKLSDITEYKEDEWERRIKDELAILGGKLAAIYEEDRRLVRKGERTAYGFYVYSPQSRRLTDVIAWEITNIKANGLNEEESE